MKRGARCALKLMPYRLDCRPISTILEFPLIGRQDRCCPVDEIAPPRPLSDLQIGGAYFEDLAYFMPNPEYFLRLLLAKTEEEFLAISEQFFFEAPLCTVHHHLPSLAGVWTIRFRSKSGGSAVGGF